MVFRDTEAYSLCTSPIFTERSSMTPRLAIGLTCSLAMIGTAISSVEYLWLYRRRAFDAGGFWPWLSMKADFYVRVPLVVRCFDYDAAVYLLYLGRGIVAMLVPISLIFARSPVVPLAVVALMNVLLHYRVRWGGEGGDQMTSLVLICSIIAFAFLHIPEITLASCYFLGAQLTLAYFSSGTAKLFGQLWRSGTAFTKVMSNYTYGNQFVGLFLQRHAAVAKIMNFTVIGFQITFPLVLVIPVPYCYIYLMTGLLFHLGVAIAMRLNLFLYTFVAVYPCLVVLRNAV
jgi:hypothetical protein